MSHLALAAAIASGVIYTSAALTKRAKLNTPSKLATDDYSKKIPLKGTYQHTKDIINSDSFARGNFLKSWTSYDLNGAKIWYVQWPDRAITTMYYDPKMQL